MNERTERRGCFRRKAGILACFFLLALVIFMPKPALAAKYKNQWRTYKGKTYYYNSKGKKVTGWQTIRKKTYYFTPSGVQRIGWQQIDGKIYYFKNAFGSRGYMRKSCKVSGVQISKTGAASPNGKNKRKSQLLVRCQIIRQQVTNGTMTKEEQLKAVYEYVKNLPARNIHSFDSSGNWDMYYAEYMLNHNTGDCYCYAALFGYLANVVGYTHVKVESSGGHGWVHIGNYYYDPNWAKWGGSPEKAYAQPASVSGTGGRPRWSASAAYVKDLSK